MSLPACLDCEAEVGKVHRPFEHYRLCGAMFRGEPRFFGGHTVVQLHCGIGWAKCEVCGETAMNAPDINHRC